MASGNDANRLFIENARVHGELIVRHVVGQAPDATWESGLSE